MPGYCGYCNQHYREHYTVHADYCDGMADFVMEMEDERRGRKPMKAEELPKDFDPNDCPF